MGTSSKLHRDVPSEVRRAVEVEAAFRCAVCDGTSSLEIHHIVPFGKGGKHSRSNLILLCATCHGRCEKGEITPADLRAVKKRLAEKDSIASLDRDSLKQVVTSLLKDAVAELRPSSERLQSIAATRARLFDQN